jgi:peroxiredoxin
MIKYQATLLLVFLLFLSAGCPLAKEQPSEKPAAEEQRQKEPAPDFTLQDLDENAFILSSYKDKQPVILFFWTTWCPFCRQELKTLKGLYPQLKKEGLELFAIDAGEPKHRVDNFIKKYMLDFKVLLDRDTNVAYSYDISGVPAYVLVDKKGYIVFKGHYFPLAEYKKLIPD